MVIPSQRDGAGFGTQETTLVLGKGTAVSLGRPFFALVMTLGFNGDGGL